MNHEAAIRSKTRSGTAVGAGDSRYCLITEKLQIRDFTPAAGVRRHTIVATGKVKSRAKNSLTVIQSFRC